MIIAQVQESSPRKRTIMLKALGLDIIWAESFGGGNRDHRVWFIQFKDGSKMQVETEACSGKWDGKAACEREARKIATFRKLVSNCSDAA